ncbi:MAG: hypothetical protein J6T72_05055, partial [Alphaproteobacteria bacterium]|nr:hypothetical protein [Alphaproteobacteria bacterium]
YDEQAKKFYEEEQEWAKQGREDLAEQARSNKERAMMDSAEMLNKANEESKKASDARAASEVYQKQAEGYWQQKENADAAYRAYEATENEERQYLRERIGLDEAEANVANSQARMAQAQQEKAATEKDLSDVSNAKKMYNEQYDRSMKEAKAADDEAASYNLAAGKASEIGDMDSYNKYSQQASEAARRAEEMRSEADASKTLANSYGEAETRLKNTAASYEEQINAEKKYQESAMATQKAKEAEYAVATGTATAEQKKLYEQAKQEEENSRFGQKATEWASKISTPGDIVRGAERTVSQGAGTVIEAAEDVGVGRAARTIGGMANTTRRLFGW